MIRKIIAPFFGVREDQATLAISAEIAKYFHAHVEVASVATAFFDARQHRPARPTGTTDDVQTGMAEGLHEHREVFDAWLRRQDLREQPDCVHRGLASASWIALGSPPVNELLHQAKFSDLVCLAVRQPEHDDRLSSAIESLVFWSGRPLLLWPAGEELSTGPLIGEPIVVGWNGSAEVARAVSAALPFLQISTMVEIISIGEEAVNAMDAYQVAKYLGWHGIRARATGIGREDWTGGDVVDVAMQRHAGLLVMGAHRHSEEEHCRNVTRHVLDEKPIPVLMVA